MPGRRFAASDEPRWNRAKMGAGQELKGHAQQAVGQAKDAVEDVGDAIDAAKKRAS